MVTKLELAQNLVASIESALREVDHDPDEPEFGVSEWASELCNDENNTTDVTNVSDVRDLNTAANVAQIAQLAIMVAQVALASRSNNDSLTKYLIDSKTKIQTEMPWLRIGVFNKYYQYFADSAARKLSIK
jgi:hypothetical protein